VSPINYDRGWINVPRDWIRVSDPDHPFMSRVPASKMFAKIDLLEMVNFETKNGVPEGCVCASITYLERRWAWTRGCVQRFLKSLEREGLIERTPGKRKMDPSMIRILGYSTPRTRYSNGSSNRYSGRQQGRRSSGMSDTLSDTATDPNPTKEFATGKEGDGMPPNT
jgi:hypothetical protein